MSESLEDLLSQEGIDDVDSLMSWAHERANGLVSDLAEDDGELAPLLTAGGQASEAPPRREPSRAAPLPPIPSKAVDAAPAASDEELDVEEIEELDVEELELVELEEDDEDTEPAAAPPSPPPESAATPPSPPPEPGSVASSLPEPPEGGGEAAPEEADTDGEAQPEDADPNAFGPPDGNEVVPEWKAALMSTQTETDAEAAERVKEASSAEPLPEPPEAAEDEPKLSGRLVAEDDEISQHSIDLSDLDTDDE
jgi:hypothetical protein